MPTFELYPRRVADYTVEGNASDLDDARDRMLDPLSYSNFLELIAEENTLPAYLYTIKPEQTVGTRYPSSSFILLLHSRPSPF